MMILKAFLPPVILIALIKGSILLGWATPSEAGAVGAFGATLLAIIAGKLNYKMFRGVLHSSGLTIAMVFMIILSATCCLLYTSPSPRDKRQSRMPSSA